MREALRLRHYSPRTERAYVGWIRRYVLHHGTRHPRELGADHVTAFLTHLASVEKVSASTQNQALAAIVFLYVQVLGLQLDGLEGVVRALISDNYFCRSTTTTSAGPAAVRTACETVSS